DGRLEHQRASELRDASELVDETRPALGVARRMLRDRRLHPRDVAVHRETRPVQRRHEVRERPRQELEAVLLELEVVDDALLEQAHRVARHRVAESRMELLGHGGSPDLRMTLKHDDAKTRAGEIRGADETVMTAADDRGVVSRALWGFHRQLRPESGGTAGVYNTRSFFNLAARARGVRSTSRRREAARTMKGLAWAIPIVFHARARAASARISSTPSATRR